MLTALPFTHPPVTDFVLLGQAEALGIPGWPDGTGSVGVVAQESALPWVGKGCQGADGA